MWLNFWKIQRWRDKLSRQRCSCYFFLRLTANVKTVIADAKGISDTRLGIIGTSIGTISLVAKLVLSLEDELSFEVALLSPVEGTSSLGNEVLPLPA